jgi:trk system potassium uptake protein TrkH
MIDIRPVGYVIGWLVAALGLSMLVPLGFDLYAGERNAEAFAASALLTLAAGTMMVLACAGRRGRGLTLQQSFLLATGIWAVFPFFGALPFVIGVPLASFTDAFFEAMSAFTTTGATVFVELETMPPGTLLWRGMMQWFGGLGIVVVAMVFLPTLRIGGMQLFRSEAFDTLGKILPKAGEIAAQLTAIYVALTFACMMGYLWSGLGGFDALVHAMTTIATGGMGNYDASFAAFGPGADWVAIVFMCLAALPFIRYLQFVAGDPKPLWRDPQIHAFFLLLATFVLLLAVWMAFRPPEHGSYALREILFNIVSVMTGTGYANADYNLWGPFAIAIFFTVGLIGGCSASTTCSVKVFRYQVLFATVAAEVRRLHSPNRVVQPRYGGQPIGPDVLNAVMAFFLFFFLILGMVAVALVVIGLAPITAISGAASALANIGPGLGPEIGPAGNYAGLPDAAKWLLALTMLVGRLEILTVLVIFTASFWRG